MAISQEGVLFAWGEAGLGQTGTGKKKSEPFPTIVNITSDNKIENQAKIKITQLQNGPISNSKIRLVAAGYGHTLILNEAGDIYTCGINIKGQLGLGDRKTRYNPEKLYSDILGNEVPKFKNIACGYHTSYAIDINGTAWSWGGGNLGQKNVSFVIYPKDHF